MSLASRGSPWVTSQREGERNAENGVKQISPHFQSMREPHHEVSGTYHSKFLTYLSSGALDLSHQI